MRIKDMFAKDIDRSINGVVKVAQTDDASIEQELSEYVVTRELRRHFSTLLDAYERALDEPTDRVGVWISGFFGSGKSHFLKMLSYLLENREVAGRRAVEYFEGKFEDPMMEAKLRRCCGVPAEAILFNIDNKGPSEKDKTAILKVFARVFYEHLGYYGEDLRLARLERFIDEQGKADAFREAFGRINGESWLESRASWEFFSDDVIAALTEAEVMSAAEAERWCAAADIADAGLSIDALTDEIAAYAERRAKEEGGRFRLLFMVDEVGQYIGGDVNLMLNLQTIVEELGAKCAGRVWVMVTSQEAIDSITKVVGSDFSKIQGRFNTRLSLSSSSVDEVIKRRVLAKTDEAVALLRGQYERQAAVLRNIFTFEGAQSDLVGYAGAEDYVETFPFASYQFKVMQDVFSEIRKHGSSGKHLSAGERSMLSGFQEAAQAVKDRDEGALVPFSLFYDTVHTFLEGDIRRVIDRCQEASERGQGIEPEDVGVLKLLFLIRYIDDIPSNLNNITVLMASSIDVNKMELRERMKASLDRLVRENYISRTGEVYLFLTDEEQDIARAIRDTQVDMARITKKIADVVYGDIFETRKLRLGGNDFAIDPYVDETFCGGVQGGMVLRVVTAASELHDASRQELIARSMAPEAIVVLSDERDYFGIIENAAKIDQYVRSQNVAVLPETTQAIIRTRKAEQRAAEAEAKGLLEAAILSGRIYVAGEELRLPAAKARRRIEEALSELVQHVYTKLDYIDHHVEDDAEVLEAAHGAAQPSLDGEPPNHRAMEEVRQFLRIQRERGLTVSMGDIQAKYTAKPFGWRELDIAQVVASLMHAQDATARYGGALIDTGDRALAQLLRQRSKATHVEVRLRERVSPELLASVRAVLKEYGDVSDVPTDEDGVVAYGKRLFAGQERELSDLLATEYRRVGYPGRLTVERGIKLCQELQKSASEPTAFFAALRSHEDDLLDFREDMEDVRTFFANQRRTFDQACELVETVKDDVDYLAPEAREALDGIQAILKAERPYRELPRVAELMEEVRKDHGARLRARKAQLFDELGQAFDAIERYAEEKGVVYGEAAQKRTLLRSQIESRASLALLDSDEVRTRNFSARAYAEIDARYEEKMRPRPARTDVVMVRKTEPTAGAGSTTALGAAALGSVSGPGGGEAPAPAPAKRAPKVKRLAYALACPPKRLSSEEEVDAYLAQLRAKLVTALADNDMVQLGS